MEYAAAAFFEDYWPHDYGSVDDDINVTQQRQLEANDSDDELSDTKQILRDGDKRRFAS
jgi:hypothetical protein